MNPQSDLILLELVKEASELALKCVSTGETLLPFLITEGDSGAIISIDVDNFKEVLSIAQERVNGFGAETSSFAFCYDGFITTEGVRYDAIYIEAGHIGFCEIQVFAQCYQAGVSENSAPKIGGLVARLDRRPLLNPQIESGSGSDSAVLSASRKLREN